MNVCTRPAFWWRAALVAVGVLGLLTGNHQLHFYTSQSNVIVLGYFAGVLYWMVRRGTTDAAAPRLRGAVTLWIAVTGLVAHFVNNHGANPLPGLVNGDEATLLAHRSTFLLHYVIPGMVFADWLAFGPRRFVRWRDLPLWMLFPLAYGLTSIARALLFPTAPDPYPYAFLDPTEQGYAGVTVQLVFLAAGITALGAVVIALDRLLSRLPGSTRTGSDAPLAAVPPPRDTASRTPEDAAAEPAEKDHRDDGVPTV